MKPYISSLSHTYDVLYFFLKKVKSLSKKLLQNKTIAFRENMLVNIKKSEPSRKNVHVDEKHLLQNTVNCFC